MTPKSNKQEDHDMVVKILRLWCSEGDALHTSFLNWALQFGKAWPCLEVRDLRTGRIT